MVLSSDAAAVLSAGVASHLCDGMILILPDPPGLRAFFFVQDGGIGGLSALTSLSQLSDQPPQTRLPAEHAGDSIRYAQTCTQ